MLPGPSCFEIQAENPERWTFEQTPTPAPVADWHINQLDPSAGR